MNLSAAGLQLLKKSEGFRDRTYLDVAGLPTIGYGHRLVHPECYPGGITQTQAEVILLWDVREAEQAVERLVKVPLSQGQFDALVDFTFNLGSGRLAGSTLLQNLNAGKYDEAAGAIASLGPCGRTGIRQPQSSPRSGVPALGRERRSSRRRLASSLRGRGTGDAAASLSTSEPASRKAPTPYT